MPSQSPFDPKTDDAKFGEVVAVLRTLISDYLVWTFTGLVLSAWGCLLIWRAYAELARRGRLETDWLIVGGVGLVFAALGVWAMWLPHRSLWVHERGVVWRRLMRRPVRLAFEDAEAFVFRIQIRRAHRAVTGENYLLRLRSGRARVTWRGLYDALVLGKKTDHTEAPKRVRDHIARQLAMCWLNRLERGESFRWTPAAEIAPEGLRVTRGRHAGLTVPLDQVRCEVQDNNARVTIDATALEVARISTGEPNFWVGLRLIVLARTLDPQVDDSFV